MNVNTCPIINLCCMTCRKADTSTIQFNLWCKKKNELTRYNNYCEYWNPSKNDVINTIYRFTFRGKNDSEVSE